ncbi:ARPP-1 family domain-containing protein [Quadrisphaera sp. KR29]|uniref:ARPP-1 family domain-containing protein n=1 Tax=Quadrisphaera sp. KR29 TaxID=3461391 RepID=UPI00404428C6
MALTALHVGWAAQVGPVSLFPVWTGAPLRPRRRVVTTGGVVSEVDELLGGPTVEALQVSNPRHRPLLLCEGTVLEGGWQTRAVAMSVLVEPGQTRVVPVACVEQGRWGGGTSHGGGTRRVLAATRGALHGVARGADGRARRTEGHERQGEVWASVERVQQRFVRSATGSYAEVHAELQAHVAAAAARTRPVPAQRGVIVGIGGHVVSMEVFEHPRLLELHWRSIVEAALMDAAGQPDVVTEAWRARSFARHAPADAVAEDPRDADPYVDAYALLRDGEVVHLPAVSRTHHLVLAA